MSIPELRGNKIWEDRRYVLIATIFGISLAIGLVILWQGGISLTQFEKLNPNNNPNDVMMDFKSQVNGPVCATEKCPYSTYDPEDLLGYPDFF